MKFFITLFFIFLSQSTFAQVRFSNGFELISNSNIIINVPEGYQGILAYNDHPFGKVSIELLSKEDFKINENGVSRARELLSQYRQGIIILNNGHFGIYINTELPANIYEILNITKIENLILEDIPELPINTDIIRYFKENNYSRIYNYFGIFNFTDSLGVIRSRVYPEFYEINQKKRNGPFSKASFFILMSLKHHSKRSKDYINIHQ